VKSEGPHRNDEDDTIARRRSVADVSEQLRACVRRLDAARGAALLASAVSAEARDLGDDTALRAAEDHLRAFAASAVDLSTALAPLIDDKDEDLRSSRRFSSNAVVHERRPQKERDLEPAESGFKHTFADHLRRRSATPERHRRRDPRPPSRSSSFADGPVRAWREEDPVASFGGGGPVRVWR